MADLDYIFQKWLESGELSPSDRQLLESDSVYRELLTNSEKWQNLAQSYDATKVPEWDRACTWQSKPETLNLWSRLTNLTRYSFAPVALTCSLVLCSLVVLRAEINLNEDGLSVQFNKTEANQSITYEQLQSLLNEQQKQTTTATYALVKEAIEQGRLERKEDISALVTHLNQIRQQDQALLRLQLNQLAEQVETQPESSIANNSSWENTL